MSRKFPLKNFRVGGNKRKASEVFIKYRGHQAFGLKNLPTFEEVTMPHLAAAYNLARWLTRDDHDAEDVVQEAYLRALKFFAGFRGGNGRAWILKIVRNTSYTWLQNNRPAEGKIMTEDELDMIESGNPDPETMFLRKEDRELIQKALEELSVEFREILILRELDGLSYKEIAQIAEIPIGTVMSRLARARTRLQQTLDGSICREA